MKRKINSQSGKTLVETLVAMIVILLAVMMLTGGIVTAARVNNSARNLSTSFSTKEVIRINNVNVKVKHKSSSSDNEVAVDFFQTNDSNKYFYYEPKNVTP